MAVLAAGFMMVAAPAAHADAPGAEQQFVTLINQLRASKGLPAVSVDPRMTTVARAWSAQMASTAGLAHNPNFAAQAPSDWVKLGENVGYGPDVQTIHNAFVNSPHHYANLVDPEFNAVGVGVVVAGNTVWVTEDFEKSASAVAVAQPPVPAVASQGYWLVARDGGVFSFGTASFKGSTGGIKLNQPIVGLTKARSGGYWFVAADGGIFSFGAPFYGSTGGLKLNQPIVGMAATPSGLGYWMVARDGGIFSFGDAAFYGSTGGIKLNQPIVGMAPTASGRGYWLVASDGGMFAFGDAAFYGSTGGRVSAPIVGMASSPSGRGYWMLGSDGAIYAFGDAPNAGNAVGKLLGGPAAGISASPNGGYRIASATGQVWAFGGAEFDGSLSGAPLNQPVVGMAGV